MGGRSLLFFSIAVGATDVDKAIRNRLSLSGGNMLAAISGAMVKAPGRKPEWIATEPAFCLEEGCGGVVERAAFGF